MEERIKEFKLYSIFTGIFCTALVLVPVLGSKFIAVGSFALNGSTLVFPINFIFNDILTEVYGYKRSRRIIWTGMGCQIFATLALFSSAFGQQLIFGQINHLFRLSLAWRLE